jgi:hypothetical protein
MITGTPRFASPEALAGQAVGTAHDVYGLYVTLYSLFSGGRLPHEVTGKASSAALRRLQVSRPRVPLRSLAPEVDSRVDRVLVEGLGSDSGKRPAMRKLVLTLDVAQDRAVAQPAPPAGPTCSTCCASSMTAASASTP